MLVKETPCVVCGETKKCQIVAEQRVTGYVCQDCISKYDIETSLF